MKKRLLSFVLCLCLVFSCFAGVASAMDSPNIVFLYENDVHCMIDGYSKLAAMKNELKSEYGNEYVGVVSAGDFVQGGTLGAVSKGEYIVNLMNLVGYDAITLGNHEFDYRFDRLNELNEMSDTKFLSCNFAKIGDEKPYFEPYTIVSVGYTDIAYVGITTPETITSAVPSQFLNDAGEAVYTFNEENLHEVVQSNIDAAREAGADYVIALSHVGYDESGTLYDIVDVIENTDGFDAVLDGHSHSVIEKMIIKDKSGDDVILSSTGTKFNYIGKLIITDGGVHTELIETADYDKTDAEVDAYIAEINESYAELGNRKVGESKVNLITHDEEGTRLVRNTETNLGNLCSDALRTVAGSDVSFVNGGGLRAPLEAGDITFNDIFSVFPFNNQVVKARVTGKVLLDMLEMAVMEYPQENGSFPHVSGMTFSVDASVPSSVQVDENGFFTGVGGEYRVRDVKIMDKASGEYKALDLDGKYTIASFDYYILSFGSGMSMFEGAEILENEGELDVEALETYISSELGGVIGKEYEALNPRITFVDSGEKNPLDAFADLNGVDDAEAAEFVLDNGFMTGMTENIFAPEGVSSRAMALMTLWRFEGSPVVDFAINFEDVEAESWYFEAVRWAASAGIVNGYSDVCFAPDDAITREQLASILWRYAKSENADVSVGEDTNILSYEDSLLVREYAIPALQWTCGSGILSGGEDGRLAPQEEINRIDLASVLYRYAQTQKF